MSVGTTREHVAITGVGAVTPHGIGAAALWEGLLAGRSAAAPITSFDASAHAVRFACEVAEPIAERLPRKLARQTDRFTQLALVAAVEALTQAGLLTPPEPTPGDRSTTTDGLRQPVQGVDPDRVGTIVASGAGGMWEMTTQHQRLLELGPDRVRPYLAVAMPLNMAAGQIAIRHGLRGPASGVVSACASAADAIGQALDLIRAGRADVVVTGGSEAAINPLTMAGFAASGAMSRRNDDPATASRPFDTDRDGFVAGEGAGILVLERLDHARARGAEVLAHLAGYGASNDAHDPTQPAPGGEGAVRALRLAIADAGLAPRDIGHVNAHGTSTPLNDAAESAALRTVFAQSPPPVTAVKSSIGHMLGAAGAVEAVACVATLRAGCIPPTINLHTQDPVCDLDVVTAPRDAAVQALVSSSFGFGGHNAVLTLTR
ncbi:beta-ketoacyl-ACP synthase II [soil metagenome]